MFDFFVPNFSIFILPIVVKHAFPFKPRDEALHVGPGVSSSTVPRLLEHSLLMQISGVSQRQRWGISQEFVWCLMECGPAWGIIQKLQLDMSRVM